jgi:SAM-dependent methyltransferase
VEHHHPIREEMPPDYDAYNSAELAEIYDAIYADRDDHAFWTALAPDEGAILELACGSGRVLLPLAREGHEIVGVDLSAQMLARCRTALAGEPDEVRRRVRLVQADMTSFELGRRFALVTSPFRGFQHLTTVTQQLACLGRCHAHLTPDGLLVLDLFNPDPSLLYEHPGTSGEEIAETVAWSDGRTIRWWGRVTGYHRARQFNQCEMTYEITEPGRATRRVTERFPMRYLFRHEVEHLLARSGFRIVRLYGDYDRSPYGDDSPELIVVAQSVA